MNKKRVFGIFAVIAISLFLVFGGVYAFSFSEWFNNLFQPKVSFSPVTGLPQGFSPILGYYHEYLGGSISLWDSSGNIYQSNDGFTFNQLTRSSLASQGLPIAFKPTAGYYHNLSGSGGAIYLFNDTGVGYKTTDGRGSKWNVYNQTEKDIEGLPPNVKFNYGAWSKSPRWNVTLWRSNGKIHMRNSVPGQFSDVTDLVYVSYPALPQNLAPNLVLTYRNSNHNYILFLYKENNALTIYRFEHLGNTLYKLTTHPSGLPSASNIPSAGYFDDIRNKIVLWYGSSAYESGNGASSFIQMDIGSGGGCSSDSECGANEECSNGACVPIGCEAYTCEELDLECGSSWSNGCGGTLNCGSCQSGYLCNQDGQCVQTQQCTTDSQCSGSVTGTVMCDFSNPNIVINRTRSPKCLSGSCGVQEINITLSSCSAGQQCSNGACVVLTSCNDWDISTSGQGTYTKGQVNLTIGTTLSIYNDTCLNANVVTEYACVGNSAVTNTNQTCPGGCSNGACVGSIEEACADNDGGINPHIRASVNYTVDGISQPDLDVCDPDDDELLLEFYCDGNTSVIDEYDCSDLDKVCKLGVCTSPGDDNGNGGGGGSCSQSSCDGQYYIECISGEEADPVRVPGQCGYNPTIVGSCEDDFDCREGYFCNSDNECERVLESGETDPGNIPALYYFIIVLVVLIIIVLIAGIYFFLQRKNNSNKRPGSSSNNRPGPGGSLGPRPFFPQLQGQQVRPQQMQRPQQPQMPQRPPQNQPSGVRPQPQQPQGINRFNPFAGK
ncbi:MAG TPA: hypothetical protein VI815_03350 [Candidatus Nanoarchaeia archaeon]|nr:hypothetical protein [Candidatus Nanoarchaeia archaeon]